MRNEDLDFGFVDIAKYSDIPDEEEVLFNPLNSFTIKRCTHKIIKGVREANEKDRIVKVIHLAYGSLASISNKKR